MKENKIYKRLGKNSLIRVLHVQDKEIDELKYSLICAGGVKLHQKIIDQNRHIEDLHEIVRQYQQFFAHHEIIITAGPNKKSYQTIPKLSTVL